MKIKVRLACEPRLVTVELGKLVPVRTVSPKIKGSPKYQQILASVRELGVIEPLVVYPKPATDGHFFVLDGHYRREALQDLGVTTVQCLVATDDEAFTYNHKVNRLSPIQEHFMIIRAIKAGVPESRIAKTLNVDVAAIVRKRDLLDGICPEAVAILKDKAASAGALREFRKVKPMRQIEMAELMCAAHNFSAVFAKCLLAATPDDLMLDSIPKEIDGLTPEDIARMEREMETIERDFKLIEESHGKNVLNLVVVIAYVKRLLDNARIVRYLTQLCPEILTECRKIVEAKRLADESGS